MRDAQHHVGLGGEPWPSALIEGLPVGLLEVDAIGCAVRENARLSRLLGTGADPRQGRAAPPAAPALVADRWPQLTDATVAVLAGRHVDDVLTCGASVLRVRGVPRRTGGQLDGGLLVVSDLPVGRPPVVDVRDPLTPVAVTTAPSAGAAVGDARGGGDVRTRSGAVWRQHAAPAAPHRLGGRSEEHAATHDPVTGLANRALLVQCLDDALAACLPGRRVGVLAVGTVPGLEDPARLRLAAARLTQLAGPDDVVARFPAGRFAVVLRDVRAGADVPGFLARAQERLRRAGPPVPAGLADWPDGLGMVLADPSSDDARDRDPRVVLATAFEALERSRSAGRPVLGTERPADAERARLAALAAYDVHDRALDDVLQSITGLTACTCAAAAALVTFVDRDLQWVRAATGIDASALVEGHGPRHLTLCDRTLRGRDVLVVPDMRQDPQFRVSRHVGWHIGMRFYAGAPLISPEGRAVGTLCVFDVRPRDLTGRQRRSLLALAAETIGVLEEHRTRG